MTWKCSLLTYLPIVAFLHWRMARFIAGFPAINTIWIKDVSWLERWLQRFSAGNKICWSSQLAGWTNKVVIEICAIIDLEFMSVWKVSELRVQLKGSDYWRFLSYCLEMWVAPVLAKCSCQLCNIGFRNMKRKSRPSSKSKNLPIGLNSTHFPNLEAFSFYGCEEVSQLDLSDLPNLKALAVRNKIFRLPTTNLLAVIFSLELQSIREHNESDSFIQ